MNVKNDSSTMRSRDSYSQPLDKSPPLTTRSGLPSRTSKDFVSYIFSYTYLPERISITPGFVEYFVLNMRKVDVTIF